METAVKISGGGRRFGGWFDRYKTGYADGRNMGDKVRKKILAWDVAPKDDYFQKLFRVSRNQIIWGGNYFSLPPARCFVVWEMLNILDATARGRGCARAKMEETEARSVATRKRRDTMGRPPKFESPEAMQKKIDDYFAVCEGTMVEDPETGKPMIDKRGNVVYMDRRPPTVTGLAMALGFYGRQSLLNYEARGNRYREILKRAKGRIEQYAEERLYDREGCMGARFNLAHNFKWSADDGPGGDVEDLTPLGELLKE